MKTLQPTWVTIRYQENIFDVKFTDHVIDEIRTVDSEVNILNIMDKQSLHAIQNLTRENDHAI